MIFINIKLPKLGPQSCFVPTRLKAGPQLVASSLGEKGRIQDAAGFALRQKNRPLHKDGLTEENQDICFFKILRKTGRKFHSFS